MNKSKVVTPSKKDRNEIAREALNQEMFQTRRTYEQYKENITHNVEIIETNKAKLINLKAQLNTGEIKETDSEGKLSTKEQIETRILVLKHQTETDERETFHQKEDMMNLMKNRDIKAFEEEIKKLYKEVEEFYQKNFK